MKPARVELKEANAFIERLHRHHPPVTGHRFTIGAERDGILVGVAIVGRPVARMVDQRNTCEVTRCCTDGTKNACSFLYATAARIAAELGFTKIQTYILDDEEGTSLRAAGWSMEAETSEGLWDRPARRRDANAPTCRKQRWAKYLGIPHTEAVPA